MFNQKRKIFPPRLACTVSAKSRRTTPLEMKFKTTHWPLIIKDQVLPTSWYIESTCVPVLCRRVTPCAQQTAGGYCRPALSELKADLGISLPWPVK